MVDTQTHCAIYTPVSRFFPSNLLSFFNLLKTKLFICNLRPQKVERLITLVKTLRVLYLLTFTAEELIQNMDPRSMDHLCGPSPWTFSWTQSMDYTRGPPLMYVDEFLPEV